MLVEMSGSGMTELRRRLSAAVRTRRLELGLSQEDLAEQSGLHRTYISDVERGERNVSLDNIGRIANALDTPISALFAKTDLTNDR